MRTRTEKEFKGHGQQVLDPEVFCCLSQCLLFRYSHTFVVHKFFVRLLSYVYWFPAIVELGACSETGACVCGLHERRKYIRLRPQMRLLDPFDLILMVKWFPGCLRLGPVWWSLIFKMTKTGPESLKNGYILFYVDSFVVNAVYIRPIFSQYVTRM